MKNLFLFLLMTGIHLRLSGQLLNDCTHALPVCSFGLLHFDPLFGPGNDATELDDAPCYPFSDLAEKNSIWMTFQATQEGSLYFTATPKELTDNLDFILYELPQGTCAQKTVRRCMAVGGNGNCLGPTGLMPGEIDIFGAGCNAENNFLAPLDMAVGKTYALVVQNFTSSRGFHLEFEGTATLDSSHCFLGLQSSEAGKKIQIRAFPNPLSSAQDLLLEVSTPQAEKATLTLFNAVGGTVQSATYSLFPGTNPLALPAQNLEPGSYTLLLQAGSAAAHYKVLVSR